MISKKITPKETLKELRVFKKLMQDENVNKILDILLLVKFKPYKMKK